jgi:Zn-dependent protease/predicted transcriptional regulator
MFGNRVTLFKILGFEVRLDASWVIIAVLITWTLATSLFPQDYKDLPPATYWWMGAAGALGLFASIVFHELCHSIVARKFGIQMKGITLFIFGGVAEMDQDPPSPKSEFLIAIAGPISSGFLAFLFYRLHDFSDSLALSVPLQGVLHYLGWINAILAVFNLVPAFPLDGGRVLRSILWYFKGNLRWATRIASNCGAGFGLVLIFLGIITFLDGNIIVGMWWVLIGLFLRGASRTSYEQLLIQKSFEGEPVRRLMNSEPITVPPSLSIRDFVEEYIYKYHFKMFPVQEDGRLAGCITTKNVKEVPQEEWGRRTVGEIARDCSRENSISPDADAMVALSVMNKGGHSRLIVVENGKLVGMISMKDMLTFLALKLDLEGEQDQY